MTSRPSASSCTHKRDSGLQRFFIAQRYPNLGEVRGIYRLLKDGLEPRDLPQRVSGLSEEKVNVALSLLQDQGYIEWTGAGVRFLSQADAQALRLDFSFVEQRQRADYRRLGELLDYLTTEGCRRSVILRYFGEKVAVGHSCGNCDTCHAAREAGATAVQPPVLETFDSRPTILAAVADLQKRGLGRSGLAQVLAGSKSRRMRQLQLDTSSHYGALARFTQDQIIEQIDDCIQAGALRLIPGQYPPRCPAPGQKDRFDPAREDISSRSRARPDTALRATPITAGAPSPQPFLGPVWRPADRGVSGSAGAPFRPRTASCHALAWPIFCAGQQTSARGRRPKTRACRAIGLWPGTLTRSCWLRSMCWSSRNCW